jgi:HlyD family secretion protein
VIVDVESAPAALGDGFRVDARIVLWSAPGVLAVPVSALVRAPADSGGGAGWRVFVVRDGRAQSREVRIGHLGSGAAEVMGGLQSGEVVVVFPSDRVAPGVRVVSSRR